MYRIVSIDGGGIRGIITVAMLKKIGERLGSDDWLSKVDLFAGTSTGGLMALALASGMPLKEIRDIYEIDGPVIFSDSFLHDLGSVFNWKGAHYDIANMEKCLKKRFGEGKKLSDLNKNVLIATFNLDNKGLDAQGKTTYRTWKPKIFHNFKGPDSDGTFLVYKIGLYTSAAPTYFQTYEGYIDGGVYASNPSMCALAQTRDPKRFEGKSLSLDEVRMVSFGTGTKLEYIEGDKNWGKIPWVANDNNIIHIMMDGTNGIADYQVRQMLGESYFRMAPIFTKGEKFQMDDVGKIKEMIAFAESRLEPQTIQDAADWITTHW